MPLKTVDAQSFVRSRLRADLAAVAGPGRQISRAEQAALPAGLLADAVAQARSNAGPGGRVTVDDAFVLADAVATAAIDQNNFHVKANLSKTDIIYLAGANHPVARLVAEAYRALTGGSVILPPAPDAGPSANVQEVLFWLETRLGADLAAAAGSNTTISRAEERAMPPGLAQDAVAAARMNSSRVTVGAALERGWSRTTDVLYRHDAGPAGALSAKEVRAITSEDPSTGALLAEAFRALTGSAVD